MCAVVIFRVDSEDDYRTGPRNVSHCQPEQSYSGLRSPERSNSIYFCIVSILMSPPLNTLSLRLYAVIHS